MLECTQRSHGLNFVSICALFIHKKDKHTPRIGVAPKYYTSLLVRRISQHFVQLHRIAVKVTNVQWAEVSMKGIVEESLINGEVDGRMNFRAGGDRARLRLGRPLAGRAAALSWVRKRSGRIWRVRV
jgi:hypothetical protein